MARSPDAVSRAQRQTDWTAYAPLDASSTDRLRAAFSDITEGLRRHRAWRYLATEQIKNQYRRTVLGPWWLTAQTAVYVMGLALVFGQLQHAPLENFLPYVATGYLGYVLLVGLTRAGANVFTGNAGSIKSTRQPLTSLVLRGVAVEFIQFGHNVLIVLLFFATGLVDVSPWLALAPAAVFLVLLNGLALGLWVGPLVARFRDVSPAIDSVLQVLVFFTPVFYRPSDLKSAEAVVRLNPYTYFIDLLRDTLLGNRPSLVTLAGASGFTVLNLVLALFVFTRSRSRLPYWVA
jgi:lipopolysaccharide transport system permease protein